MKHIQWVFILIVFGGIGLGISPNPTLAQKSNVLPLSVAGPYNVLGMQEFSFVDQTRTRTITGYIWYPAGQKSDAPPGPIVPRKDLPPDTSAAPYPLVIYSHGRSQDGVTATTTLGAAPQLASYGFAVLSIEHNDPPLRQIDWIQRPLDILFVLNQLPGTSAEDNLAGLIDFDHVGMTGYSLGASTALLFSGAEIDMTSREQYCATAESSDLTCAFGADVLQQMIDERALYNPPPVTGEPWPAYTDERIVAVMPVAPCFGPAFGERGLANATLPTLIVGLERDERCLYERDALYMYEHLGSEYRALLTVFKQGHVDAVTNREAQKIFNHFTVAFFGYYLQGKTDYMQYLTADSISEFSNLEWLSAAEG